MKRLILVRHAKSSWNNKDLQDIDRPLNKRGERDAPEMGRRMAKRGVVVDLILTSPAIRAQDTAKLIAEKSSCKDKIKIDENLYDATAWEILDVIRKIDDHYDFVMLVGHNPGMTDLVNELSATPIEKVPTCGVFELDYDMATWPEIATKKSKAFRFDYPKRKA